MKNWTKKTLVTLSMVLLTVIFAGAAAYVLQMQKAKEGKEAELSQEEILVETQQDKLAELERNEGLYSEDAIVLADTQKAQAKKIAKELGAKVRLTKRGDYAVLYLPEGLTIQEVYKSEAYRGYLMEMSPDYYVKTSALDARNKELLRKRPNYTVNDEEYSIQEYLDYIDIRDAWNTSRGSNTLVAVIDTGIDTDHAEFQGRISAMSYNASEDKMVKDYGMSVIEDEQGHGTAVAGVLSAAMNDGMGIAGIAPEAELLVIKCECDASGMFTRGSDLVFGLAYAIERDADVVNMSFGAQENVFGKYTKLAADSDIICVAAAGNEGSSLPVYPAADEYVIGVGAMDTSDWSLASYSNFGDNLEVIAPGTVYTTTIGGNYKYDTGTSLASPIVAAAVTLYRSSRANTGFDQMEELLQASSTDLGSLGQDWYFGYGNLDVYAFLCEEKGTITYDMLTDEVPGQSQIFVKGHTVQSMPEPERENVVFDGWYYDSQCTDEVEYYEDVFHDDITLYAKWINEDEGSAYRYIPLPDGTVEIQSYTGKRRYLTIPQEIEGMTVSSIGEGAFENHPGLRSVSLPAGLKKIGRHAFCNCTLLRSIDIPEQVESIGEGAFLGCARLTNAGIAPNGALSSIGSEAFSQCGISAFEIPVNLRSLGERVFYGSASLGTIRVAEGNESYQVKNDALYNKAGDTLLYYPVAKSGQYQVDTATTVIGDSAFAYSRKNTVLLPEGISKVGEYAFASSLVRSMELPGNVTELGQGVFQNCNSLQRVVFADGSRIAAIPGNAFTSCGMLKDIIIPSSVKMLGAGSFGSSGLQSVSFEPDAQLETIGREAFSYTPLKEIGIPANNRIIDKYAFNGCTQLEQVEFAGGSRLQSIGREAFFGCRSLTAIVFPESLRSVGEQSFFQSGLVEVTIGKGLAEIGDGAFASCQSLEGISVEPGNQSFASYDDVLYNAEKTELILFPAAREGSYTLADETRFIRSYALAGAQKLNSFLYNNKLKEIGSYAFSNCSSLETPKLPASLETIGLQAFEYCSAMDTRLMIPKSVKSIGRFAFLGDYNLTDIRVEAESSLSRIGYGAFGHCGIRDFTVPGNVFAMGQEVFTGCENLRTVTFEADSLLENLAAWTFQGADDLRRITFEENSQLSLIEARACQGLDRLEKIDLSSCTKLRKVGNYAFRQCAALSSVNLPVSTAEIGRYAFQGCEALSRLDIPKEVSFVGRYAFVGTGNINVYFKASLLPAEMEDHWDFDVAGYYMGVTDVVTSGDWTYALTEEGDASVISYHGSEEYVTLDRLDGYEVASIGGGAFKDNDVLKGISLPKTVTGIYQDAFAGTTSLETITIPASVQVIDSGAFQKSGLGSIVFEQGSRLASLGRYAFAETRNLTDIQLPDAVDKVREYAFYKSGLSKIDFGGAKVSEIGRFAFSQSKLTSIQLPDTLAKIDYYAFSETEELAEVAFGTGTKLDIYGNAFYRSGLQSVSIPWYVNYIGELCFTGCSNLTAINVEENNSYYSSEGGVLLDKEKKKLITCPAGKTGNYDVSNTVTVLAFGAFEDSKLSSIRLPKDSRLGTIGYRAFYGCGNLSDIVIPDSVQSIGNYAFAECARLASVSISSKGQLSGIYKSAFYNCKSLRAITIPDAVQEISDYAFYGCSALVDVAISEASQMKGVYGHAFEYSGIASFVMPKGLEEIGAYAFHKAGLSNLVCNEVVTEIGDYAFADCGLAQVKTLVMPGTVEYLGNGALKGASELRELTLPFLEQKMSSLFGCEFGSEIPVSLEKVVVLGGTQIAASALQDCSRVKSVVLPEGVISIGSFAFAQSGITEIHLPGSLERIEAGAFDNVRITEVSLPDGVEYLGYHAFSYTDLETITLPSSLSYIGDNCFFATKLTEIYIPENVKHIGTGVFTQCEFLKFIDVDKQNEAYASLDGILYNAAYTALLQVPVLIEGDVVIADSIRDISDFAFSNCVNLCSVKLPQGLRTIGDRVFNGCNKLVAVNIPNSVEEIGEGCFTGTALKEITLGTGIEKISENMFASCGRLKKVTVTGKLTEIGAFAFAESGLEEFICPDSLTFIDNRAFMGCNVLKYVCISPNVSFIGRGVFDQCGELEVIEVDKENADFVTQDGLLYRADFTSIVAVPVSVGPSVEVPEGITVIEDRQFMNCKNLTKISLPRTLESIGESCFQNCERLRTITVGNQIKKIGGQSLLGTAYYNDPLNWEDGVLYLSQYAMKGRDDLSRIHLKEGTVGIASGCFSHNDNIKRAILPDSVAYIGDSAFSGDSNLAVLRLGSSVKRIGVSAFYGCPKLRGIQIPQGIEQVEYGICAGGSVQYIKVDGDQGVFLESFEGCENLKTAVFPKYNQGYFYAGSDQWPSNIVLTKRNRVGFADVGSLLYRSINLYSSAEEVAWEEEVLEDPARQAKIYFANEWHLSTFYVDGMIIQMDPLRTAQVVQAPAENFIQEYIPEGSAFVGWDINGDGKADRLPVTLTEDLEAHAVYDAPITSMSVSGPQEVEAGREIVLKATYEPDGYNRSDAIRWSSLNESVASIDENGKVTGILPGQAVITATLTENPSITASYTITVIPEVVYGITLKETEGSLNIGENRKLEADLVFPKEDIDGTKWISSNEDVATVQEGWMTALAPGKTEIQIIHGEYKASYQLTVKAPLQGIALNTSTGTMRIDRVKPLEVIYEPSNTTDDKTAVWSSSDESVAIVDENGAVTALSAGTARITATVGTFCADYEVTVVGIKDHTTGIIVTNSDDTSMDDGISMHVEEKEPEGFQGTYQEAWEKFREEFDKWLSQESGCRGVTPVFDISFIKEGTAIQPGKQVDVEIPLPQGVKKDDMLVYRIEEDGTIANIHAQYQEGRLTFQTEYFSVYALGLKSEKTYVDTIILSEKELTLCPGKTAGLKAEVLPESAENQAVAWVSSNDSIVTVTADGKVTAVAEGAAVITATADDGGKAYAECVVTVCHKDIAIWSTDEEKHWKECQCGEKIQESRHKYVWVVDQAATEESTGLKHEECETCEAKRNVNTVIDKIPAEHKHNYKPDWSTDEEKHWKECQCGETSEASQHSFGEWAVIREATCTETGIQSQTCEECGYHVNKEISVIPHTLTKTPAIQATCETKGNVEYYTCSGCKKYFADADGREEISLSETETAKTKHHYESAVTKATTKKDGRIVKKCSVCGEISNTEVISYPKTVTLSKTSYSYTGKALKPAVKIKDSRNTVISPSNYKIGYSKNKAVGTAVVKITFQGKYSGTISKTFDIIPKGAAILKATAKSKGFTIKWKKQTKQVTGYEIQYSTSKKFTKKATVGKTVKKSSVTKLSVSNLKAKKKYYVRIRTYQTAQGKKYVSGWSKPKSVSVKK